MSRHRRSFRPIPALPAVPAIVLMIGLASGPVSPSPARAADPPGQPEAAGRPFGIRVIDDQTGRGVPLVELRTVNQLSFWTDSNGLIAFSEPGLLGREVFFSVSSHGYEFPQDGFGFRGARLKTAPGGSATLKIKRLNIAERLYRVTGEGIYRDSVLLGEPVPVRQPLLNAQVLGSDSVQTAVFNGRLHWFWGDTNRPSYPLGNFHAPGATTLLPDQGGLDPAVGADLEYFLDENGFAKGTCLMPGPGPTWIDALTVVPDGPPASGTAAAESAAQAAAVVATAPRERLFAKYVKVRPPLEIYEQGLAEFNPRTQQFEHRATFDLKAPAVPFGHPFRLRDPDSGTDYVWFADPYPLVRVPAQADALADLTQYEAWSYFTPGSRGDQYSLDRDPDGRLRLGWKRNTLPVDQQIEQELLKSGALRPAERFFRFEDPGTGKPVIAHRGSVAFNRYRDRWVMIFCQQFGSSLLGEIWYAEAAAPTGPWERSVKVLTHDRYSFYNPMHHPYFDQDGGRVIYFEGTYTATFSGNDHPTPQYDYNQIMYRLDLSDPRLRPN